MSRTISVFLVFLANFSICCAHSVVSLRTAGVQCADCRHNNALNYYRKTLPTSNGFWCLKETDRQKILVNGTGTNTYGTCVPGLYSFSSEITDFCCFWGPDLGCGQLVGTRQQQIWSGKFPKTCNYCEDRCSQKPKVQYCADCRGFNEIHYSDLKPNTTGFSCLKPEDTAKVYKGKQWKHLTFKNTCVPRIYAVEGEVLDMCCFWTPKMGCGQLVGKTMEHSCDYCKGHCPSNANIYGFINILLTLGIMNCALV